MRSPSGASAAILRMARQRKVGLLANVALALEYEALCLMDEHWRPAGLTYAEAVIFVDAVIAMVEPVESHFMWRPQLRDPADEFVLEAAVNGRANAIVTFNIRDFAEAPARFGVSLYTPSQAFRSITP
jgi:predicted nucleic acid-binding protein